MYEWYYVGQFGQLGPLSSEQMVELVESGVVGQETYVWKRGMRDWMLAEDVPDLRTHMHIHAPPPPPPGQRPPERAPTSTELDPVAKYNMSKMYGQGGIAAYYESPYSRVLAGILQIFLPGIGRIYLGYHAIGVLQLLCTICTCGVLWLWPLIDGILILAGQVRYDGYARALPD